jgi:hypothetical protein
VHFGERRFENKKTLVLVLILAVLLSFNLYELLLRQSSVPSVSAVDTGANIGVYWDANCTQRVDSISWGALTPGQTKQVVVYVRNEGNETPILALIPENWQPQNAYLWLNFSWTCQNTTIGVGQVVRVTQILSVASNFPGGFSNFSFDIAFEGTSYLLGDINKDGFVNIQDLAILAAAYGSTPGDPRWNPQADLNKDGIVNFLDLWLLTIDYGKNSTR